MYLSQLTGGPFMRKIFIIFHLFYLSRVPPLSLACYSGLRAVPSIKVRLRVLMSLYIS